MKFTVTARLDFDFPADTPNLTVKRIFAEQMVAYATRLAEGRDCTFIDVERREEVVKAAVKPRAR